MQTRQQQQQQRNDKTTFLNRKSCFSRKKIFTFISILLIIILKITIITIIANGISETKVGDSSILVSENKQQQQQANSIESNVIIDYSNDVYDLDVGASEISQLSANSHKIVAFGWPSTSSMWPSTIENEQTQQQMVIEPFIYADKPRSIDYSLLLSINDTILNILKSRIKPMAIQLSFEYYFNYDLKLTALPAIKIEIDRKQYKHLEPTTTTNNNNNNNQDNNNIKAKIWMKFNELISITDPQQFSNHDWLKFSLVIRQSPSLVAIRRLKAEFLMNSSSTPSSLNNNNNVADTSAQTPPSQPSQETVQQQQQQLTPAQTTPRDQQQQAVIAQNQIQPNEQQPPVAYNNQQQQIQYAPQAAAAAGAAPRPLPSPPQQQQQQPQQPTVNGQQYPVEEQQQSGGDLQEPAASNILETKIKPVENQKKKGWIKSILGKRRRKRQALDSQTIVNNSSINDNNNTDSNSIVLTCFRSDQCDWKADSSNDVLQWSLARMPPSTNTVQSGYYYVSNRDNYGDASKLLVISLNQTDSATIADQNADHCIELALYVTEKTYLKLYRLNKIVGSTENQQQIELTTTFTKENLLLSWAPTMTTEFLDINLTKSKQRTSLPKSRLLAIENNQNGWTLETICFGDFFINSKECGSGNCYFGFEMETATTTTRLSSNDNNIQNQQQQLSANFDEQNKLENKLSLLEDKTIPEQVVGVALLKEFTLNIPMKLNRLKWLEIWQRDEVEPSDNWKFYPKLDFEIKSNNISLLNLFDNTHYYVESDWLNVDYNLDFTSLLLIEVNNFTELTLNSTSYINLLELLSSQAGIMNNNINLENNSNGLDGDEQQNINIFNLKINTKLMDSNYDLIYKNNSTIDWRLKSNNTQYNLGLPITEHILAARNNNLKKDPNNNDDYNLFKIVIEFILQLNDFVLSTNTKLASQLNQFYDENNIYYKFSLSNISVSDRCYPNPCQFGTCQQNGTGYEDWNCQCDDRHRGRRCDFGKWCNIAHVTPWQPPPSLSKDPRGLIKQSNNNNNNNNNNVIRQSKLISISSESITRITGKEYCQRKLGIGYKCTDIDLPLNDNLYTDEDKTFQCSCQDNYYLSDDSKCKQAHLCNSVVCPSIGMICDENKPFNRTQPCHCNEKQDWFPKTNDPNDMMCVRHQCQDIKRDCGFDAHICLPTLPGEKPICKCGPKFTLKINDKGQKYCESTACVLPTLNDCDQICLKDNSNLEHPYNCACHPGYVLNLSDKRSCKPEKSKIVCKPGCQSDTQICTEAGCKCKQGFIGESEVIVQKNLNSDSGKNNHNSKLVTNNSTNNNLIDYVQSVRCLNICSLTYAENKSEFEMVESVCPLGLCDPKTFQCRCSDPSSSALINTKYEPIYANSSSIDNIDDDDDDDKSHNNNNKKKKRISPLCHLRRVCEPNSSSYKICRSQGAICVPDYTKSAMFDCICPPSTEKKFYGQATSSEFTCEPKCSSKKFDCLRKQAICKLVDKDQVRCDCLPGLMFDQHDQKCYLAKYSYAFNLIIVNRYYEPESKFHKLLNTTNRNDLLELKKIKLFNLKNNNKPDDNDDDVVEEENESQEGNDTAAAADDKKIQLSYEEEQQNNNNKDSNEHHLSELVSHFQRSSSSSSSIGNIKKGIIKSIFIKDYNQCNITQVIPKAVIEDPYEHDIESYLSYIDQCNEKLHQNVRTYHLNSKLSEDLRQSLRQHLRDFTVTTNNSSCFETDLNGMFLNCTIYLQSNEPILKSTIDSVFNDCDKNAYQNDKYCWIKPRLLLKRINNYNDNNSFMSISSNNNNNLSTIINDINFNQIIPCELDNFCGLDAISTRLDDKTSLCACKCPTDIEVIDVKDLESRKNQQQQHYDEGDYLNVKYAIKEICAPRNHCGANSTFCLAKTGSVCQYDIRLGSKCNCVYPSYEDSFGKCVEVIFSQLDNTLIIIIILLGTGLIVSVAINLAAVAKSKSLFGHSKQYPLNEFSSSNVTHNKNHGGRHGNNRSTGIPNPVFTND